MIDQTNTAATTTIEPVVDPVVDSTEEKEEPTLLGDAGVTKEPGQEEVKDEPKSETTEKKVPEAKIIPEKYEFKLPEGMKIDQESIDLFSPIFKELGLTNEGAQKLVEAYVPLIQSNIDRVHAEDTEKFNTIKKEWKEETLKTLGADADKKLALVARALNKFGDNEIREDFDKLGVGNKLSFVRLFMKVGESVTEDTLLDSPKLTLPGDSGIDVKKMYPSMPQ